MPDDSAALIAATDEFATLGWHRRLFLRITQAQFLRYLCVGAFNTLFGYTVFVVLLTLLNHAMPARFLYLTVILASIISNPINITVAFFGYKFFVFRTQGNYLREWLKCFAVYGTSMLPGLIALSALTGALQSLIHRHSAHLHATITSTASHLSGSPLRLFLQAAHTSAIAGKIAGAIIILVSTIFSFIGHKKVTFRQKPA